MKRLLIAMASAVLALVLACSALGKPLEMTTVQNAARVLQESVALPSGIPVNLMSNAQAIAIIPDVLKLGFVVGGRRGHGVMVARAQDGSWTNPVFITLTGGSVGYQVGVQATDVILVFQNRKSVDAILNGQFTLGADAAVAAGPVGRQAAAGTDIQLKAEIYSYCRSRGLFLGVSLDGSVMQIDGNSNGAYYATPGVTPYDILIGKVGRVPAEATYLKDLLARYTPPVPGGAVGLDLSTAPVPMSGATNVEVIRQQLVVSAGRLHARLDDGWRKYLALPAGMEAASPPPSVESVVETLKRFDVVAQQSQYGPLLQMPEFQATHAQLRTYLNALSFTASRQPPAAALPPPPGGTPAR